MMGSKALFSRVNHGAWASLVCRQEAVRVGDARNASLHMVFTKTFRVCVRSFRISYVVLPTGIKHPC